MRIVQQALLNLVGLGAPLLLALVAIPILVEGLGTARFGLLTLIWALVSYLGLLDLGIGRALTLRLALLLDEGGDAEIGPLCGTALALLALAGLMLGMALYALAPWLTGLLKGLPDEAETLSALRWLAAAMPFVALTSGLRGMLEARGAFGFVNAIRLPLGLWSFGAPVLVLAVRGPDLAAIAATLTMGRLLGTVAHAGAAWRVLPQARRLGWGATHGAALFRSGGWLLLCNVLGPLMGYADRFIVGLFIPVATLAYYSTPQEMAMKLWVLPGALAGVLFPALAAQIARREEDAVHLCRQASLGLAAVLLPITLGLATLARPLLVLWLGDGFAANATTCTQLFCLGMLLTGLAQLPYTALQSAGRADVTARLHLLELPLFVVALSWAAANWGIEGAATVWLVRVLVDAALLLWAVQRLPMPNGRRLFDAVAVRTLCLSPLCFASLLLPTLELQLVVCAAVTLGCLVALWRLWQRRSRTMLQATSTP